MISVARRTTCREANLSAPPLMCHQAIASDCFASRTAVHHPLRLGYRPKPALARANSFVHRPRGTWGQLDGSPLTA